MTPAMQKLRDEFAKQYVEFSGDSTDAHTYRAGFDACYSAMAQREAVLVEALNKILHYADPEHYIAPQAVWAQEALSTYYAKETT